MAAGVYIDGNTYALTNPVTGRAIQVLAWYDTNGPHVPEFKPGDGYNKKRRHNPDGTQLIDLVVWHWTGGENSPDVMAETLRKRKLGVEFAIGRHGELWQFCDPTRVDTADAGVLNHRSIGVEIVCYGYRAWGGLMAPKLGLDRETYDAYTHGQTVKTARFYDVQMQTAFALAAVLSNVLPIPHTVCQQDTAVDDLTKLRGHCGHYQITTGKRDPGPWFMEQLGLHLAKLTIGGLDITRRVIPHSVARGSNLFPDRKK